MSFQVYKNHVDFKKILFLGGGGRYVEKEQTLLSLRLHFLKNTQIHIIILHIYYYYLHIIITYNFISLIFIFILVRSKM